MSLDHHRHPPQPHNPLTLLPSVGGGHPASTGSPGAGGGGIHHLHSLHPHQPPPHVRGIRNPYSTPPETPPVTGVPPSGALMHTGSTTVLDAAAHRLANPQWYDSHEGGQLVVRLLTRVLRNLCPSCRVQRCVGVLCSVSSFRVSN